MPIYKDIYFNLLYVQLFHYVHFYHLYIDEKVNHFCVKTNFYED